MLNRRLVFYLLGRKGYSVLNVVIEQFGPSVIAEIIIGNDEGVVDDYANQIASICLMKGILHRLRTEASSVLHPDGQVLRFAIGWRWLISDIDDLVVLHDSPLPKYRGFAPLVNMLIAGESEIGVSALLPVADYDAGPIIAQRVKRIEYPLTISRAIDLIIPLYCDIVIEICGTFISNQPFDLVMQIEADATYSAWRDKQDYRVNWSQDAGYISRMIDAVGDPYGGACTASNGGEFIVHSALALPDIHVSDRLSHIGKVIYKLGVAPVVICGCGLVRIDRLVDRNSGVDVLPHLPFRTRFA